MNVLTLVWGILVGVMLPIQAAANGKLIRTFGHPMYSGLWNFASGAAILVLLCALVRYAGLWKSAQIPQPAALPLSGVPTWAWVGGALGAFFVVSSASLGPRIGALMLTVLLLTGQLLSSAVIDRFGLLSYAQRELSPLRLAGLATVVAGVVMVYKGTK